LRSGCRSSSGNPVDRRRRVRGGDGAGASRAESEALKRLALIAHRFLKPMPFFQLLDDEPKGIMSLTGVGQDMYESS
jgi:hypothetical protein